ncbi:hypothetical protein V1512DRAFT_264472 [Lipomyces arxii]|uniref:uncharacterized protein n=1 Tax=Lipomyces arxii TaxID=56418 RepID=UPI0034CD5357
MTAPVRIGLIGTGIFASTSHVPAIHSIPERLTLTACANRTVEKAKHFATEAGLPESKIYSSLTELINDPEVDAIDALLPASFSASAVKEAVAAGKPIAIEKPIAANLELAREVVAVARSTDLPVAVLENFVFWNAIPEIKKLLPQIGKIVYFSHYCTAPFNTKSVYLATPWRLHPQHVGGYLSDGGVHQVALFTEVLGEVDTVSGMTTQVREQSGDVDSMTTTLKMKSGLMGTFTYTSAVSYPRINRLLIHGVSGTVAYDFANKTNSTITLYTDTDQAGTTKVVPADDHAGISAEFANFAEAVQKKDKSLLKVPAEKGFHHFAVICAAVESAKNGGTVVKVATP